MQIDLFDAQVGRLIARDRDEQCTALRKVAELAGQLSLNDRYHAPVTSDYTMPLEGKFAPAEDKT